MHRRTRTRRGGHRGRLARRGPLTALLTLGLLAPLGVAPAAADVPTTEPFPAAAGWVAGELATRDDVTSERLADALLTFAASGSAGDAAADAFSELEARADTLDDDEARAAGSLAKAILAAAALDEDPGDLGGFDAEAELRGLMVSDGPDAGQFTSFGGRQLFVQSLAVLALSTTAGGAPDAAVSYLVASACDDGSYTVTGPPDDGTCSAGDVDTTAVALQARRAAGEAFGDQTAWLLDQSAADGSFPASDPNSNSSALAAQALRAAGNVAEADAAAAFVTARQKGCDAPAAQRGAIATYPDADGDLWLATTQGPFATSASLDELDVSVAAPDTSYLSCSDAFCPPGSGVSVVVDFTTLAPGTAPEVACAARVVDGASGLDVLGLAGLETRTERFDFGDALCTIEGLPALEGDDCFDPAGGYWAYWTAAPGGPWESYEVGGADTRPEAGTIEGWSWAPSFPAAPPRMSTTPAASDPLPTPPYDRGIGDACPGSYPDRFVDTAGSVHEPAIRCLAAADLTRGTSDPTRYAPRDVVTRAQLASFLARSYQESTGRALPAGPDRFPDDDGSTHERNIDALAESGVIAGVGDGSRFAPNATVTRGQMATLLTRFLDLLDDDEVDGSFPPDTDTDVFADDEGSVHADAIDRLAVQGVVQGRRDGSYGPQAGVTRDQLASFLARALDLAVTADLAAPLG